MSTVDRALAAAARLDYGGPETRALVRLALDADHDTGENTVTATARVHEAAGYGPRDAETGSYRAARRTIKRLIADGVLRCDADVAGIGRSFTCCPTGPWSGAISSRTTIGRKLAARLGPPHPGHQAVRGNGGVVTPDTQPSGVTPDTSPGHVDVRGNGPTPDTTPDTQVSDDQRTNFLTALSPDAVVAHATTPARDTRAHEAEHERERPSLSLNSFLRPMPPADRTDLTGLVTATPRTTPLVAQRWNATG